MNNIELLNEILNDFINFHLVIFGIALSIFTLLYSFILSKRDELKSISAQVKCGNTDPMLAMRESFAKAYIQRFRAINKHILIIACITFIEFILNWSTLRFIANTNCWKKTLFVICVILTILTMIYIGYIFVRIYKQYREEIKI